MKKSFFLLSIGILLVLTVMLILFLGINGLLESLVHAIGLSTVIILFLLGFSLLFLSLIDRRYMMELKNIIDALEIISRNSVDLTYRFNEKGIGETFALNKRLNEFFSLLHNYLFKLKRLIEKNQKLSVQTQEKTVLVGREFQDALQFLGRMTAGLRRNTRHLHDAKKTLAELKSIIDSFSKLKKRSPVTARLLDIIPNNDEVRRGELSNLIEEIENDRSDVSALLSNLLITIEKSERYIYIAENSLSNEEAGIDQFLKEFRDIVFLLDGLGALLVENGFINNSMQINAEKIVTMDTSTLRSTDGISLVGHEYHEPDYPTQDPRRPENPEHFSMDDSRHWYDLENAGWGVEKVNLPVSPADGVEGKQIMVLNLFSFERPYTQAYLRGMLKMADAFGIDLDFRTFTSNYTEQIKQAVLESPDLLIIYADDAGRLTPSFKFCNESGVPLIVGNSVPEDEGMKYVLGACGPDDWGMGRLLARELRNKCDKPGGYCILRDHPETQKYISRTFSVITEFKELDPGFECLDMQPTVERDGARMIVTEWINRFGDDLKMIVASDPGECLIGMNEALRKHKREDVIRGVFGNSLISQQFMKERRVDAMIWQSAEGEGAMALEMAVDWFNGLDISPILYLPMKVITHDTVDSYFPAQW